MKKTMFITSVIMVVVMAIALTTSSLAWFTATGSATVTTSTLTLTAKANASTGIQITDDLSNDWAGSISLTDQANLMPILPYVYTTDKTMEEALVAEKFIANQVDSNLQFVNTEGTEASTGDWFVTTDVLITNMAQGASAAAVDITPSIAFKKSGAAYDPTATANVRDPNLCVAVLCNNKSVKAADGTTPTGDDDWELVKLFNSKGQNTVKFGKAASAFVQGADATQCYTTIDLTSGTARGTQTATNYIDPITLDATTNEYRTYGEVVRFKIVAWYDGVSLVNSNSGTALQFELTFSATTHS